MEFYEKYGPNTLRGITPKEIVERRELLFEELKILNQRGKPTFAKQLNLN